ncbi:MAG: hypothetical protein Q8O13_03170 [Candidatus Omnitrophota bacterium]|nr:hypothetical protein [Candidatus Omnitrophota bacterium]
MTEISSKYSPKEVEDRFSRELRILCKSAYQIIRISEGRIPEYQGIRDCIISRVYLMF